MQKAVIEGFRLSPQQEYLFLLRRSDSDSIYRADCIVLIEGSINKEILKTALQNVVDRHEILHTTFHYLPEKDTYLQAISVGRICWDDDCELNCFAGEEEEQIAKLLEGRIREPFKPGQGSLMRSQLIVISDVRHALLISLPAVCADSYTLKKIAQEISRCYQTCIKGDELNDEPPQYADLSEWQLDLLESEKYQRGAQYWRKQDFARLLSLNLPFENGAFERQGVALEYEALPVNPATAARIERLADESNTSASIVLLIYFEVLLWRLTEQSEIIIGVVHEGRQYAELQECLGPFAKVLPIRCQLKASNKFAELLERTDEAIRETHRWQSFFSWEYLKSPDAGVSSQVFLPFCFEYQEEAEKYSVGDILFYTYKQYVCGSKFKIKLRCVRVNGSLLLEFHYNSALLQKAAIARIAAQFEELMRAPADPRQTEISKLEMLSEAELNLLLVEFNKTNTQYDERKCVHELFEDQVERTPQSIALIYKDQSLSYLELNQRANQLAHYLLSKGAGPESIVGIYMERSLEMVIGLLGILKSGSAYVPLDPEYPGERLAFMMADAQVKILLTQQHLAGSLPAQERELICLDEEGSLIGQQQSQNIVSEASPDNLVYVIYTSGSTGKPKGAMNTHRAVCNRLLWMQDAYGLSQADRVLQKTPFSFDVSVWEFFWPLITGARLVLAQPWKHRENDYLVDLINAEEITTLHFVPSMLRTFLQQQTVERCTSLKRVICSGEPLSAELQEQFLARVRAELHNLYGPTEAAVDVTFWKCGPEDKHASVPIGRPIANIQIYLLDAGLRPVPIGLPGELHIGGVGVGRGYLNQADLTAEKFIPNLFGGEPGSRLYKTGDLARYRPDGNIEFLGRIDYQVKIRGFRIELGEIESVLAELPAIKECVVDARDDGSGNKRLVAYLVLNDGPAPKVDELRNLLKQKLPEYMVPSSFVTMDELPLTPNGKLDRRALPEPGKTRPELGEALVAPRTQIEETLAEIWGELLGLERAGVYDNFFKLGGHSLLAAKLISLAREAFNVEVPLRDFYDSPTIASLSEFIEATTRQGERPVAHPIPRAPRDKELPLSYGQQRLWFLEQIEPGNAFYNIPAAVRLSGSLDVPALSRALNEITKRHESLRTHFIEINGQPVQIINPPGDAEISLEDLSQTGRRRQEAEALQVARQEASQGFNLQEGPLYRMRLLKLAEREHIMMLTMHHIISDAWSAWVFVKELVQLYEAYAAGKKVELPELVIQYPDYAVWQREELRATALAQQLQYWKNQLEGMPTLLEMPTDRPRPRRQSYNGTSRTLLLGRDVIDGLKRVARLQASTVFMTLSAAFATLLHRYSGQTDIFFGSPTAGRNRAETEPLIGFFVNTLVMRIDFSGDLTYRELLSRVREVAQDAFTNQDIPFEKVVEELNPERSMSYSPLFQHMIVLNNIPRQEFELDSLKFAGVEIESDTVKFDLVLSMQETQGRMSGTLAYNTDLFDDTTAERITGHLQSLIECVLTHLDERLGDLPMLRASEKHQLLVEWNYTESDYPAEKCIHELFEDQVERTPDAIAVSYEAQQMSYCGLNQRANQMAHYLRSSGVGPEVLVGILMDRSIDMVVSLLGVLKAGGAYVPLDPSYPDDRLSFMVEDSQVAILLTHGNLAERLHEHSLKIICVDKEAGKIVRELKKNPCGYVGPQNLAYLIYTSGSTGMPKAVMITHQSLCNQMTWAQSSFPLNGADNVLQKTPFGFDASVWEFFAPLLVGARLIIAKPGGHVDPAYLLNVIAEQSVTYLQVVPTLLRMILEEEEDLNKCHSLRLVLSGGETLTADLMNQFFDRVPAELWNLYGPTEATINTIAWHCERDGNRASVPVGRPIANTQVYLLDSRLQLSPIGSPADLYIGGECLARGYLNHPDLTAEKFIPDPLSGKAGKRLYKTGDRARYLPDGHIEYMARSDRQVKVRGFRIELGEIEALIRSHAGIENAVVMVREDTPGDQRLVAYIVERQGQPYDSLAEVQQLLKERLPAFMIPSAYISLETLPRTPNGKLDQHALPLPDAARRESVGYVPPATPVEKSLAAIWGELLHLDRVSAVDSFFNLGGHSLLAVQLISRVRKSFLVQVPLRSLLEKPTISDLAATIEECLVEKMEAMTEEESEQLLKFFS